MFRILRKEAAMAVRCNLSSLMGSKRYSIQDVHEKTGLSRNTVSNLYNDKASRIDYTTIDKLCALFECQVKDLLVVDNERME